MMNSAIAVALLAIISIIGPFHEFLSRFESLIQMRQSISQIQPCMMCTILLEK